MLNKQKLLSHLNNPEDKLVMARMLDKAETVIRTYEPQTTDFYDPYQLELADGILRGLTQLNYNFDGGFPICERQKVILCPDYLDPGDVDHGLVFLKIAGNLKFQQVTHRDYLGSIMALGIKREKIGDLNLFDKGCYLAADEEIASYVMNNLTQVHRIGVTVVPITMEEVVLPAEKVKEIQTTVPSLRLDVVASSGFGVSRSAMAKEISTDKVKVNWVVKNRQDCPVEEGDIISIRGRGRVEVAQVGGRTKKDRIAVVLKRFI